MKIAIDGPAGSGKTSVGRALAERFGCRFVETGKMYRAVALAFRDGLPLEKIDLEVTRAGRLTLNGEDVSDLLHTPEIDQASSEVATIPAVRERLVGLQRAIAETEDVVMEGRDIGTVVWLGRMATGTCLPNTSDALRLAGERIDALLGEGDG